jgi:hypothetical protein
MIREETETRKGLNSEGRAKGKRPCLDLLQVLEIIKLMTV